MDTDPVHLLKPGGAVISPAGKRYLLGDLLGDGSFGEVYDCLGPFEVPCALKVARPQQEVGKVREQWLKEASRLYRLRHPHIVYVHDYFEADEMFFLVLERCDHTLEAMIRQPFTDRLVVDVARQLLFAIQYLADNDIVHNDLHAGNVLAVQGETLTVKLSDLGIAQDLFGQGRVRPELVQHRIMAPEVAAGGYSSAQSDLYQMGLLMFHMHTGEPAIEPHADYDDIVEQIRRGMPRAKAEALGTPLSEIISVMLRRHEQYRYTSAIEVWSDLARLDVWSDPRFVQGAPSSRNPGEESPG